MNSFSYKILGFIFLLASGLIYALEDLSSVLSTSIIQAGFFSGQMSGSVPEVEKAHLFDNLFVPLFFLISLVLLVYGFKKRE
ncbi:hypothetical protein [Bacillus sp. FSL K6-3431]|uniref:hypothetical protein n=1 Tax=Bacillus sp. FSL K6-3431 TaxID=2921500 RepID=UPI0030FA0729